MLPHFLIKTFKIIDHKVIIILFITDS